jgi:chromosome segregation ATPase
MSCQCNELKRNENVIKIYENFTKQILEHQLNNYQISYNNLLAISEAYTKTNEADLIIKPIIKAIKDYDAPFNQKFNTANLQIDGVAKEEAQAISVFKDATNDINTNIQQIQKKTTNANIELNKLREKTTKAISNINTQIYQIELTQKKLQDQMKALQDEIKALQSHLNDLNWAWMACLIPILCFWLPLLIQEILFNKSQKEAELRNKVTQLNSTTTELGLLKNQHKTLTDQLNSNNIILATIQNSNSLCIFMLNNLINISQALNDIDVNETPILLRRLMTVLKQSWDELVAKVSLLAASLNIN